ncbi:MAG: hypothetical protein HY925_14615 [Elusimicrobia bacterium]|nr:hypothetical protein [Elusimicrobiota bacterium]
MEPILTAASRERALLVNRYAMPFAVMTVCLGVILGTPEGWTGRISFGLLVFGAFFNLAANRYLESAKGSTSSFIKSRIWVNLACNAAIVWMLGGYWTPAWLLLALSPLATAIYSTAGETMSVSMIVAVFILVRYGLHAHGGTPLEWGEQACYGAFVVLSSLMINALVRQKTEQPSR